MRHQDELWVSGRVVKRQRDSETTRGVVRRRRELGVLHQ